MYCISLFIILYLTGEMFGQINAESLHMRHIYRQITVDFVLQRKRTTIITSKEKRIMSDLHARSLRKLAPVSAVVIGSYHF